MNLLLEIRKRIHENGYGILAGNIIENNRKEDKTYFFINKQSALNNNFRISDEDLSPLGDIEVEIVSDQLDNSILWLCSN